MLVISKILSKFENDNIYNFQYESLANQDITIDLLHAGILIDREIHANNYKKAAKIHQLLTKFIHRK